MKHLSFNTLVNTFDLKKEYLWMTVDSMPLLCNRLGKEYLAAGENIDWTHHTKFGTGADQPEGVALNLAVVYVLKW